MNKRNIASLVMGQALVSSGPPMIALLGGLLGADLAPNPAWATLPVAFYVIGMALATVPAALIMQRLGRRKGFVLAALVAGLGALLATGAVIQANFWAFCAGAAIIGATQAFAQQYRFAAAESASPEQAGQAVSLIMVGGILAGIFGPQLALAAQDWLPQARFSGSFAALVLLYLLVAGLIGFGYRDISPVSAPARGFTRSLVVLLRQPAYLAAMLAATVGFAVMSFVMTATPLHLVQTSGYSLAEATFVIQSHIVAMFLPSLFTGFLIARAGIFRVMLMGLWGLVASLLLAVIGQSLLVYWLALVLLGIGWNFLFVGGTVLLTRTYQPGERFQAQAMNDFVVFGSQAIASFSAGGVLYFFNWDILNWISLLFLAGLLVVLLAFRSQISAPPELLAPPEPSAAPAD